MNSIKTYVNSLGRATRTVLLGLAVIFVSAGIAQATTTTIDTSVSTTNLTASGTLTVTGASTFTGLTTFLGGATTTQLTLLFGDTIKNTAASTTVLSGTLTMATSSMSGLTVTSSATLASTTATSLKIGQLGTKTSQVIAGYCVATTLTDLSVATSTGTTSSGYADCVPYTTAGVAITTLTAGTDRVLVQATSSLPYWVVLQAASTTAATKINVRLTNTSTTTIVASGAIYTFNFLAFQ